MISENIVDEVDKINNLNKVNEVDNSNNDMKKVYNENNGINHKCLFTDYNEVLHRKNEINIFKDWLQEFEMKKREKNIQRGVYVYGAPGSGKTHFECIKMNDSF